MTSNYDVVRRAIERADEHAASVKAGQFYEYAPGGGGPMRVVVRVNKLKGGIAQCTMMLTKGGYAVSYAETGVHVAKLGRLLDRQEAEDRGWGSRPCPDCLSRPGYASERNPTGEQPPYRMSSEPCPRCDGSTRIGVL